MVQDGQGGEVVVSGGGTRERKPNFFQRIAIFLRQVFAELRKVVTPTRQELVKFTLVVLGFVLVVMAFVYGLDWVFTWLMQVVFGVPGGS
ncbi:MAG TPA: preprotein translocase subunit SecE [Microbacterium sp.]|nr:preprotein translocase subunit SecE [Microbacterium sp.]